MTSDGQPTTVDDRAKPPRAGRKPGEGRRAQPRVLILPPTLTVQRLAELLDQNPIDVIKQLMRNGIMAAMNQVIDYEVATLVTNTFGIRTSVAEPDEAANSTPSKAPANEDRSSLSPRPPVVTILGHVDHGKTTILDTIRRTKVADQEVGGITQHIGAYQVEVQGQLITFLDTPGHEAFTAIRARGARVTDIAVLVVAADDGLMPQTLEAIDHVRAADVPIVVAINKMDLPGADADRVKRQLSERDLLVEEWGGDTIAAEVSASTGQGIDDLLSSILVLAEVSELRADTEKPGNGVVIEAKLDRKRGPTATLLVQEGQLKVGDYVVAGSAWGRIRALTDAQGNPLKEMLPGSPGEILGFGSLPEAGDVFTVVASDRAARTAVEEREKINSSQQGQGRSLTLEEVVKQIDAGDVKELNLVLKADVQGSVEAARQALESLGTEDAKVRVLHSACGTVTESDVMLASASDAIVMAFAVGTEPSAERLAERMGVEVRRYNIIYQLIDDVELGLAGMLDPVFTDVLVGRAEVREIFPSRRGVQIAGCRVTDGRLTKGATVRVMREGDVLLETTVSSLRHFRDEVNEATAGSDCGIILQGYNEFQEGDLLEAHRQEAGRH